jgi:hypothetical protein
MKKALITILTIGCCVPVYAKQPINGVSAVEPPPPGYDPEASSAAVNAKFNLPPEPDPVTAPRAHRMWLGALSAKHAMPTVRSTMVRHGPAKVSARTDTTESAFNPNWSGTSVSGTMSPSGQAVTGMFVVPSARLPFGVSCPTAVPYAASLWAGIDDDDVLQAGVGINVFCVVSGGAVTEQPEYYAWVEWFPSGEVEVSEPAVNPGDLVFVEVWNTTPTQGWATIYNYSTNTIAEYAVTAPSGVSLQAASAEWIVERPDFGGQISNLVNYVSVPWAEGETWNYAAPISTVYSMGDSTVTQITMMDNSGNPISAATIENESFLWFQTSGSACGVTQNPC